MRFIRYDWIKMIKLVYFHAPFHAYTAYYIVHILLGTYKYKGVNVCGSAYKTDSDYIMLYLVFVILKLHLRIHLFYRANHQLLFNEY